MEKAGDLTVPPGGEQAYGQVTDTLNNIWKTPKGKASALASRLSQQAPTLSGDQQLNAFLFTAVAHQRAGEMNTARDFYQKLLASPETPHANTASYQLRMLETEPDNLKAQIKTLREVFGKAEKEGWYLHQDNWALTESRTTAAKSLITLQADQISFRFFDLIYQRSIFPKEYAYLFIFLVVLLAAKLITLPLSFRSQQFMVKLREAQPEIDWINSTYSDNPTEKSKQLMSLYQSRGINYWSGCLVGIVDLVFVVWFFLTVRSFAPQFYLDGARFWLADDITVFSLMLILAWIGVMMVQSFVTYLSQPKTTTAWQTGCGGLVFFAIVAAVAYYFKTPAYGFILYGILALGSLLVSLILMPFATIASKR